MLESLTLPFVQRGMVEVVLLAVGAGLVGTWVVLRGLAFYAHAVGTATFPGLVVAAGVGVAPALGAGAAALLFALAMGAMAARRRPGYDTATALVLVGALALGVLLASDVFEAGGAVDALLFGSLLLVDAGDVALAGAAGLVALLATALLGRRWVAAGFDEEAARTAGLPLRRLDLALLLLVALVAVACLSAVGALLATALLVVPAATTRGWFDDLRRWQLATVGLAAAEGLAGVWLSSVTDAPPGATIAVLAGAAFAVAAVARVRRPAAVALAAAVPALALALAGCGEHATSGRGVEVVATTPVVGDLARNVAGGRARVVQLLPPDADAHEFEPRPSDVRAAADARVVLTSGKDLDPWADEVVEQSGSGARVVDLGAGAPGDDPHWWQDPAYTERVLGRIAAALGRADPAQRAVFAANARAYARRLRAQDARLRACLSRVPPGSRKLVTDHDALGRFARHYGLEVVGAVIPARTTGAQASAGEVAGLRSVIRREGVPAVFPEASVPSETARALARETGASAEYELYGDGLGPEGSPAATYLGMLRANADAVVRGLTQGRERCA